MIAPLPGVIASFSQHGRAPEAIPDPATHQGGANPHAASVKGKAALGSLALELIEAVDEPSRVVGGEVNEIGTPP